MSRLLTAKLLFFLAVFLAAAVLPGRAAFSQGILSGAESEARGLAGAGGPQNSQRQNSAEANGKCRASLLPSAPSGPASSRGGSPADSSARLSVREQARQQLQNLFSFKKNLSLIYVSSRGSSSRPRAYAIPASGSFFLRAVESYLGRGLSSREAEAFSRARKIGHEPPSQLPSAALYEPERLSDSGPPGEMLFAALYEPEQLLQKRKILEEAGFSPAETEKLIENGATAYGFEGMDWSKSLLEIMFFQNFLKGGINRETAYFLLQESSLEEGGGRQRAGPGKIIKKTGPFSVLAEIIDGGLQTREMDLRPPAARALRTFFQGNPDLELAFRAIKSEAKTAGFLPSRGQALAIRREADRLKALGFGPAFLRGFEELMEAVLLKEALIQAAANPYTTHIEYFAKKAPEHIAHIRAGIEGGGFIKGLELEGAVSSGPQTEPAPQSPEAPKRPAAVEAEALERLALLEKQAAEKIQKKEVSYVWWLEFNVELAKALSPLDRQTRPLRYFPDRIKALINLFPSQILIPSAKGAMGVLALNMAGARGVQAAGMVNKNTAADGRLMSPMEFAAHDVEHIHSFVQSLMGAYSGSIIRDFYFKYERMAETLPAEKRKIFETVYFLLFPQGLDLRSPFIFKRGDIKKGKKPFSKAIKKDIIENIELALKFQFKFKGLIELSKDPKLRKQQIKSMAADFLETAGLVFDQSF